MRAHEQPGSRASGLEPSPATDGLESAAEPSWAVFLKRYFE